MKNQQTIYISFSRFVCCIFIFTFFNTPSVNAQKLIKIGYSVGSFKQKNYFTESDFNAQSLNLGYEKGIKAKSWSFGLTLDYLKATTFYDSENGTTYKFDDQYFSLEPNWKYYFGQKTNSAYMGFGLPVTASKYDLLSGVSAKLGFQKQISNKFSAHIGANYSLQMPIDDPGTVRR